MRRFLILAGAALVMAGLFSAPAQAQLGEFMDGRINNLTSDAFGCAAAPCNLWQRYYGDKDPVSVAPPGAPDGYPRWAAAVTRYVGDTSTTANYSTINTNGDACEAWYSVWTGVTNPDVASFVSYYGAQSTIITFGEPNGQPNLTTCDLTGKTNTACFGALSTVDGAGSPGAPGGDLASNGGLSVVPVPTVTASDSAALTVDLAWPAVSTGTQINQFTATQQCPSDLDPPLPASTFTRDGTPPAGVLGVQLFVYIALPTGGARTLSDLEGVPGTDPIGVLGNAVSAGLACSGTGADTNCPGMHLVSCSAATGATCLADGDTFDLAAQAFQLTQSAVDGALGADGPLDATKVAVFNTKVLFTGALPGGTASGAATNNPSLVSLFSANSTKVSFDALISNVALEMRSDRANLVHGTINTVGGPFVAFHVEYAPDGISFEPVTTIPATGAETYTFTHKLTGRRANQVTYKVIVEQPDGEFVVMETIDVTPGRGRGR